MVQETAVRSDQTRPWRGEMAACASHYPIDYLIKAVIPNSPPSSPLPFSRLTSPETLDATRCAQPLQGCADQVDADAGTLSLEVGHAKCPFRLSDRSSDKFRLLSSRRRRLSETFLELLVGGLENEQSEIDVRPRIVSAIVPAART